jgi:hypothetical protein
LKIDKVSLIIKTKQQALDSGLPWTSAVQGFRRNDGYFFKSSPRRKPGSSHPEGSSNYEVEK